MRLDLTDYELQTLVRALNYATDQADIYEMEALVDSDMQRQLLELKERLLKEIEVEPEAIYGACQDCGQVLTRQAYELHNASHILYLLG